MSKFNDALKALIDGLDPDKHSVEIRKLQRCRNKKDLAKLADDGLGWLSDHKNDPRLRLVKHHSGTFLVLEFVDGWGTTLAMVDFWG